MEMKRKEYFYEVDLEWKSERVGVLKSLGLPEIEIVTPPEFFKGQKNKWTPEHMLAGAVSSCLMNTFLAITKTYKLEIIAYKSHAFIKLDQKENKLAASEILIRPHILLLSDQDLSKAIRLMEKAELSCPLKNAMKLTVNVHTEFEFLSSEQKIRI